MSPTDVRQVLHDVQRDRYDPLKISVRTAMERLGFDYMDTVKALDLDPNDIPPADDRFPDEPEDLYDEDDPRYDHDIDADDAEPRFD